MMNKLNNETFATHVLFDTFLFYLEVCFIFEWLTQRLVNLSQPIIPISYILNNVFFQLN